MPLHNGRKKPNIIQLLNRIASARGITHERVTRERVTRYKERYLINKKRLNFAEAQGCQDFTVLVKQRVVNFLLAAYTSFDNAVVWRESTPMSEPERFGNYV